MILLADSPINLRDSNIVITGANGNLGRVFSRALCSFGANLILTDVQHTEDHDFTDMLRNQSGGSVVYIPCDLGNKLERTTFIKQVNELIEDLFALVNNAAYCGSSNLKGYSCDFKEQSLESWQQSIEVNLTAPFHLSQGFSEKLGRSGVGSIINISSIYGLLGPDWRLYEGTKMGNPAAYAVSKGGLIQLTRWLATTLAPSIRVNAICPGGIYRRQDSDFVERYVSRTPLKRMAKEDDISGALIFLVSHLSTYVTGQILTVDGGWSAW